MQESIQKRWRFKLGLDEGIELPAAILKMHPSDINQQKLEQIKQDIGATVPTATLRMFIEQVSPFRFQEGSKDHFLNECINEMYLQCEAKIQVKCDTIVKMKSNVDRLNEIAENEDMFGEGEDGAAAAQMMMDDEDGKRRPPKPIKTKMCKKLLETGKCNGLKDKTCKFAHNAIELSLIPTSTKIKNLNAVITAQNKKLVHNKSLESWVPAGKQSLI